MDVTYLFGIAMIINFLAFFLIGAFIVRRMKHENIIMEELRGLLFKIDDMNDHLRNIECQLFSITNDLPRRLDRRQ